MRLTKEQTVYFVNHVTKTTTWIDPRYPTWQKGELPTGWEMRLNKERRVYFANHMTGTTTWNDPRDPKVSAEPGKQGNSAQTAQGTETTQKLSFSSSDLSAEFEDLDIVLQYAITCAGIFCAACYPVHIYRGFGCGVLDDVTRGMHPLETDIAGYVINEKVTVMDKILAYLKCLPLDLKLLKKSPNGVEKTLTQYDEPSSKDAEELAIIAAEELVRTIGRCGFPQPKDKRLVVKSWGAPCASRRGKVIYSDDHKLIRGHADQMDAGRFLFAWLVWNRLDLRPGELQYLMDRHIVALAEWLEGLNGMTFKLLKDEELEWTGISFAPWFAEKMVKITGNEHGITGQRSFAIRDSKYDTSALNLKIEKPQLVSAQPDIEAHNQTPGSTLSKPSVRTVAHRRLPPPPPPPVPTYRLAKAKFTFQSADPEEMSFAAEDMLEILDDKREDGWWMARLNSETGLVPMSYLS